MCALKVPFDAPSISALVQKICKGPIPSLPANFSSFTRTLCSEMLNRNANARPSPEDILARPRIHNIVKELLGDALEAKGGEAPVPAAVEGAALAPPAAPVAGINGPYRENAGAYKRNDLVEYNSTAHKDWLNATVINVDGDGRIVIDLKPNTWITRDEQAVKIRPRRGANANAVPPRAFGSPMRHQSPARKTPIQRSPSAGAFEPNPRRAGTPM